MNYPDKLILKRPEVPSFVAAYPAPQSKKTLIITIAVISLIAVAGVITYYNVKRNRSSQNN